jgi:PleD family two-component response regulator
VGVAAVSAPESLQATLVDAADRALYRAKAAGRNAVAA